MKIHKPRPCFIVLTGPLGNGLSIVFERIQERLIPFHFIKPEEEYSHSEYDSHVFTFKGGKLPKHLIRKIEDTLLQVGKDVLIATDVRAASWITKQIPYATTIFITPDSVDVAERNLKAITKDPKELFQLLKVAKTDMAMAGNFQYAVVNQDFLLDRTVDAISVIVNGEHHKIKPKITSKPLVFLCHSKEDKKKVKELHSKLKSEGLNPWLDEVDIKPGKDWELEIVLSIRKAQYFLVCLSRNAINKRGYIQKEIKLALEEYDKMPEGQVFLIPVKLEDCDVPLRLSHLQWVDIFTPNGMDKLISVLNHED